MAINRNKTAEFIIKGFALQALQTKFFKVESQFSDNEITSTDAPPPEASFGQAVFTNLEFAGGSFQTLDGDVIAYQPLRLDTVLMSVSMPKNIVTTAIQGRSGTVKEYASDGDFEINVQGVLVGEGQNEYPSTEVEILNALLTVPERLEVTSEFLDRFGVISPTGMPGINEVVITDFAFQQQEGYRNVQLFNFKMLSDTPIELTI
jgi:hypothetical protein